MDLIETRGVSVNWSGTTSLKPEPWARKFLSLVHVLDYLAAGFANSVSGSISAAWVGARKREQGHPND